MASAHNRKFVEFSVYIYADDKLCRARAHANAIFSESSSLQKKMKDRRREREKELYLLARPSTLVLISDFNATALLCDRLLVKEILRSIDREIFHSAVDPSLTYPCFYYLLDSCH